MEKGTIPFALVFVFNLVFRSCFSVFRAAKPHKFKFRVCVLGPSFARVFRLLAVLSFVSAPYDSRRSRQSISFAVTLHLSPRRPTPHCRPLKNPDHLLVFAAGNAGDEVSTVCTIGSPAIGKNVLAVGSSSSGEMQFTSTNVDGGEVSPGDTPAGIDTVSYFSSYGPSTDGRVKPEIVAPGDGVRGREGCSYKLCRIAPREGDRSMFLRKNNGRVGRGSAGESSLACV